MVLPPLLEAKLSEITHLKSVTARTRYQLHKPNNMPKYFFKNQKMRYA